MFEILKILYDSPYAHILWFKWGTALYFFYWLPRFSVDLDFDLVKKLSVKQIDELKNNIFDYLQSKISKIKISEDIKIKIDGSLENSFRYIVQYGGQKKLKIEVNSYISDYQNLYQIKNLFWVSVLVMDVRYMFAHKLCALISRYQKTNIIANRDLFDILFLLQKSVDIAQDIIQIRTKIMLGKQMNIPQYMQYILSFLQSNQSKIKWNILQWLWELLDNKQKTYMKNNFLEDLINYIQFFLS